MNDIEIDSYGVTTVTRKLSCKKYIHIEMDGIVLKDYTGYKLESIQPLVSFMGKDLEEEMLQLLGFELKNYDF